MANRFMENGSIGHEVAKQLRQRENSHKISGIVKFCGGTIGTGLVVWLSCTAMATISPLLTPTMGSFAQPMIHPAPVTAAPTATPSTVATDMSVANSRKEPFVEPTFLKNHPLIWLAMIRHCERLTAKIPPEQDTTPVFARAIPTFHETLAEVTPPPASIEPPIRSPESSMLPCVLGESLPEFPAEQPELPVFDNGAPEMLPIPELSQMAPEMTVPAPRDLPIFGP